MNEQETKKGNSRVLKFRAWDKVENLMCKPLTIKEIVANEYWPQQLPQDTKNPHSYPDDFILMQFTGLLDKNKKEIYEGDRIRFRIGGAASSEKEGVVEYFGYYWGAKNTFGLGNLSDIEIIGNIYENPELLTSN